MHASKHICENPKSLPAFAALDVYSERRDSLTAKCRCHFFLFTQDQHLSVLLFPAFYSVEDYIFFLYFSSLGLKHVRRSFDCSAAVLLVSPVPRGEEEACSCKGQGGEREICQAVVQLGPAHNNTHIKTCLCMWWTPKTSSVTLPAVELKDSND